MAPLFASTRVWICRTTVASTFTTDRAQASAALPPSCTPPWSPCPSFWTLVGWRTGLAVPVPTLCGKNGCSRPTQSLSSWGLGPPWTDHPAGSIRALLQSATQTFVYTANHYNTIRVSVTSLSLSAVWSQTKAIYSLVHHHSHHSNLSCFCVQDQKRSLECERLLHPQHHTATQEPNWTRISLARMSSTDFYQQCLHTDDSPADTDRTRSNDRHYQK